MKHLYNIILFVFFTGITPVFSQTFTVSGTIKAEDDTPIEFANVILAVDDTKEITGTVSEENGKFEINVVPNNYTLSVSFIGYKTHAENIVVDKNIDFGTIRLKADAQMLEELTVVGRKALFERKTDRLVFNVENSIAATGGDVIDALRIVPGVRVDNDQISMIARGNLIVTVDDRIIPLSGDQLIAYLRNIPTENIQSIEVITNPPARYDASGNSGIINIVMKKAVNDSWNLSFRGVYQTYTAAWRPESDGDIDFNYKKNRLSLYGSVATRQGSTMFSWKQITRYPTENWISVTPNVLQKRNAFGGNVGLNYRITDSWQIGGSYHGWIFKGPWTANTTTTIYDDNNNNQVKKIYQAEIEQYRPVPMHAVNFNTIFNLDSIGRKVSVDLDYFRGNMYNNAEFFNNTYTAEQTLVPDSYVGNRSSSDGQMQNYSAKVDVELPMQWIDLNIGGRITPTHQNSDFRFYDTSSGTPILDTNQSNVFSFQENIQAAFISAQKEISKKFYLQAGLRMEHTSTESYSKTIDQKKQNSYTSFFPTAYLLYRFNDTLALSFNYGKRINRPGFFWLNPFKVYSNPYEYTEGSPFLKPVFSHNLELSLTTPNFEHRIWYTHINDDITYFPFIDEETRIIRNSPMNFINYFSVGFSETYNFNKLWWWNSYNNVVLYYIQKNSTIPEALPRLETVSSNVRSDNDFMLNKRQTWILNIGLYYEFPHIDNFEKVNGFFNLSAGIKAKLLDNNLIVALTANDILNTASPMRTTMSNGIKTTFQRQGISQFLRISVVYRIGNRNIRAERRNGGNKEEQERFDK